MKLKDAAANLLRVSSVRVSNMNVELVEACKELHTLGLAEHLPAEESPIRFEERYRATRETQRALSSQCTVGFREHAPEGLVPNLCMVCGEEAEKIRENKHGQDEFICLNSDCMVEFVETGTGPELLPAEYEKGVGYSITLNDGLAPILPGTNKLI